MEVALRRFLSPTGAGSPDILHEGDVVEVASASVRKTLQCIPPEVAWAPLPPLVDGRAACSASTPFIGGARFAPEPRRHRRFQAGGAAVEWCSPAYFKMGPAVAVNVVGSPPEVTSRGTAATASGGQGSPANAHHTSVAPVNAGASANLTSKLNEKEGNRSTPRHPGAAQEDNNWGTATLSFLAGGFAGALAKTVIAPLDRIKILFQISHMPFTVRAVVMELRRTLVQEGFKALFKGNAAQVLRVYPYSGVQLMSFDQYARGIQAWRRPTEAAAGSHAHHSPGSRLTGVEKLAAGSMAGATSVIMTYPLDLMRARLAVAVESPSGDQLYHKQGLFRTFFHMYNQHGLTSFYRGMLPTLLGIVPYAGISFAVFEQLKQAWSDHFGEVSTVGRLVCGGVAGLAGQSSTYPLDIVRRRMQTEGFSPIHAHNEPSPGSGSTVTTSAAAGAPTGAQRMGFHTFTRASPLGGLLRDCHATARKAFSSAPLPPEYFQRGGMVDTTLRIIRRDGVRGLFKGLTMNLVKGPVGVGISFTTYDILKRLLHLE